MAVDTRNKRFSMIGFGRGVFGAMPNPDGGFAVAADRAQLSYLYAGITLSAPSGSSSGSSAAKAFGKAGLMPRAMFGRFNA